MGIKMFGHSINRSALGSMVSLGLALIILKSCPAMEVFRIQHNEQIGKVIRIRSDTNKCRLSGYYSYASGEFRSLENFSIVVNFNMRNMGTKPLRFSVQDFQLTSEYFTRFYNASLVIDYDYRDSVVVDGGEKQQFLFLCIAEADPDRLHNTPAESDYMVLTMPYIDSEIKLWFDVRFFRRSLLYFPNMGKVEVANPI